MKGRKKTIRLRKKNWRQEEDCIDDAEGCLVGWQSSY
jgi:hypothetical protein